jgi:aerobic carbon-monoxide dehydrogenase small subunit
MTSSKFPNAGGILIKLSVNGEAISRWVQPRTHLVDFLREDLGLTGSRVACEHGVCGACTVQVDGKIVRGCLTLAVQMEEADVWTIEGLSDAGALRPLQDAFHTCNAAQCGYCTTGMLLTANDLLRTPGASCTRQAIRSHISGNLCRCTGYQSIVDAIEKVATSAGGTAA